MKRWEGLVEYLQEKGFVERENKKEEKESNILLWILAIIGAVAAVAAIVAPQVAGAVAAGAAVAAVAFAVAGGAVAAACRADGHMLHAHQRRQVIHLAAAPADVAVHAAMELIYIPASSHLVQAIDILRNDRQQLSFLFPLRQFFVRDIRLGMRIEHARAIELKEHPRIALIIRMGNDRLRRFPEVLMIQPVYPSEIRDARFCAHARTAKEHNASGFCNPRLQGFQFLRVHPLSPLFIGVYISILPFIKE